MKRQTCCAFIQLRFLCLVDGNGDNSGRDTHRVTVKNHGGAGVLEGGWNVVYTSGGGSAEIGQVSGVDNLHWLYTGDGCTVGDAVTDI